MQLQTVKRRQRRDKEGEGREGFNYNVCMFVGREGRRFSIRINIGRDSANKRERERKSERDIQTERD